MAKRSYQLKTIAHAFRMGICLSYRGKLREYERDRLYELLDDMAVALTAEAFNDGKNRKMGRLANILGELSDLLDIPLPNEKRRP